MKVPAYVVPAAAVVAAALVCCSVGLAQTWYVTPGGTGDAPTIQAAADLAAAGDTIMLADGVFSGPGNAYVEFHGSAAILSESRDPSACIVTTEGYESGDWAMFLFYDGDEFSVEGVTLDDRHCRMEYGIDDGSASRVLFRNNVFLGTSLLLYHSGDIVIEDNIFTGFEASWYLAVVDMRSSGALSRTVTVKGNTFRDISGMIAFGAVVLHADGTSTVTALIEGNRFENITGGTAGHAMLDVARAGYADIYVTIAGNVFRDCGRPNGDDGVLLSNDGAYNSGWIDAWVSDNLFVRCSGSALNVQAGSSTMIWGDVFNNTFTDNEIGVEQGPGNPAVLVRNCIFWYNRTYDISGVSVWNVECCDITDLGGWQYDCFSADPLFCDPIHDNYRLDCRSPCVNVPGYGRVGAYGVGCGPSSVEPVTWGAIKAMYR
ncbi:MAG: right-handed parallel beta-helix repeat-containing protein [bacterium]